MTVRRTRMLVVVGALAALAATLGAGLASSHTTTNTLHPVANGTYIAWFGDIQDVDETSNFNCGGADSIGKGGATPDRESFTADISSIPNGSMITSVAVTVRDGASAADADGTYQTFVRINTTDTDSGVNLAATPELFDACSETKTQTIDVPDIVKSDTTTLEMGVVKTPPDGSAIRVGTITATVTYNQAPSTPTLSSPADGSTTIDATPTFDWSDATDPDSGDPVTYDLQVDDDCGFLSPELDETGLAASTFTPGSPLALGTYCWRARAVDDGNLASPWSGTWTIAVDDPPTAVADTATVAEDDPATTIAVLANDQNADGGPMTIGSATQPANGTVVVAGGGLSLTYEPDPGYCNDGSPTDDFTYSLSPGGSTATVAVTVTCVDDPPTAVADTATVAEDDPATTIAVLANDQNADGGPMTIGSATQPANGTVVVAGGGLSLTYEPDPGYCNDGSPTDDFTYSLSPGGSTATVAVTVTCVSPPTCDGLPASITGGPGDTTINGTNGPDVIIDLDGNNTINGLSGDDRICTGAGDDVVLGGNGDDVLIDTGGTNTLDGGKHNDRITAGSGNDTLDGGSGRDVLDAGDGNNTLRGGMGNDQLTAGAGDDFLDGGPGSDTCDPGGGTNTLVSC